MRTFIAIELPKEIKDALASLQKQLITSGADVKWVKPENIHLTLKFLGERDDKKLEKIAAILEEVAKNKNVFAAGISSIGAFPGLSAPRIIWIGIGKGDSETKEIVRELEEKIALIGIPKETKPFSSHITIGRTRSNLNREKLVQAMNDLAGKFGQENLALHKSLAGQSADYCSGLEFLVTKITLFKSTLTPKGPIYEILKEGSLKTA